MLGVTEITKKKHKKSGNVPLNRPFRGYLLKVGELQPEDSIALFELSWEQARWVAQIFHHWLHALYMACEHAGVLILELQIFSK